MDLEDLAQMVLAKDHDVIQALPTDRANQPLGVSVLPSLLRAWSEPTARWRLTTEPALHRSWDPPSRLRLVTHPLCLRPWPDVRGWPNF
jgi:hypothetical protein